MPKKRIFDKDERENIEILRESGKTISAISKIYKANSRVIANLLKEMGISTKAPRIKINAEDLKDITKRYLIDNESLEKIAKSYPWGRRKIADELNKIGVKTTLKVTEQEHKKALKAHGKVELIGTWVNTQTLTLYRCIEHNNDHFSWPQNVAKGMVSNAALNTKKEVKASAL